MFEWEISLDILCETQTKNDAAADDDDDVENNNLQLGHTGGKFMNLTFGAIGTPVFCSIIFHS